ncbi:MAG TPA: hypothetical protein VMX38_21980 [Verrucomicrobiae bacterium]|jgi:hypothetical protein|nr:hypothetical protein [Verrucomicrobiae bacterium]
MRIPLLVIHIAGGTVGVISGYVAVFLLKGSQRHALAGRVFVASMLTMAACGTVLAVMKSEVGNILGGLLTFYMVFTAWLTGRHRDGKPSAWDYAALPIVLAVVIVEYTYGIEAVISPTGAKDGYAAPIYLVFGTLALLALIGDVRMFVRGGILGNQRLFRHLWRMCFGLFVGAASIFLARQQLFPVFMRKTGMLFILSFLPLVLIVFWRIRLHLTGAHQKEAQKFEMPQHPAVLARQSPAG